MGEHPPLDPRFGRAEYFAAADKQAFSDALAQELTRRFVADPRPPHPAGESIIHSLRGLGYSHVYLDEDGKNWFHYAEVERLPGGADWRSRLSVRFICQGSDSAQRRVELGWAEDEED